MNFSEDGTKLIVGVFSVVEAFETGGCYVYNGDGTKLLHTLLCEDEGGVSIAFMSPNIMILAVAWYEKVCVFNVVTRYPLYTFLTKGYRYTKVITFSKMAKESFLLMAVRTFTGMTSTVVHKTFSVNSPK